jgi:hypothetical protein
MVKNGGLTKPEISSIGICEVFIELIVRGFKPRLPKKVDHVRGAVLFATSPVTGKEIKIIVKATIVGSKRNKRLRGQVLVWPMNEQNKTFSKPDAFYCFVHIDVPTRQTRFFIMPSEDVAVDLKAQYKQWLQEVHRDATDDDTFPARFCVGVDAHARYSMRIPIAADIENRWDVLTK